MSEYPRISRGLGKLTPDLWGRLMDALEYVETVAPELQVKRPDRLGALPAVPPRTTVLLRVTGALPFVLNPVRWRYGWESVQVDDGNFATDVDGPTSGSEGFGLALNAEEAENTTAAIGTTSYGIPNNPGIGQSVEPLPIPDGSIVVAVLFPDVEAGVSVPVFAGSNALLIGCG